MNVMDAGNRTMGWGSESDRQIWDVVGGMASRWGERASAVHCVFWRGRRVVFGEFGDERCCKVLRFVAVSGSLVTQTLRSCREFALFVGK